MRDQMELSMARMQHMTTPKKHNAGAAMIIGKLRHSNIKIMMAKE